MNTQTRTLARVGVRGILLAIVAGAHVMIVVHWIANPMSVRIAHDAVEPMYAEFFSAEPPDESVFKTEANWPPISGPIPELPELAVASLMAEPPIEGPMIDPMWGPDIAEYSERANLSAGKTVKVILTVAIGADGAVISAEVLSSTGDEAANDAALDYARATRWIPGTVGGEPRAMQASLTVILGEIA
jgi:TonB family protein